LNENNHRTLKTHKNTTYTRTPGLASSYTVCHYVQHYTEFSQPQRHKHLYRIGSKNCDVGLDMSKQISPEILAQLTFYDWQEVSRVKIV